MSITLFNELRPVNDARVADVRPSNDVWPVNGGMTGPGMENGAGAGTVNGVKPAENTAAPEVAGPVPRPAASDYPAKDYRGAGTRDLADIKMDQIRELLFGEAQRHSDTRLALLESHVREIEAALHHRLDAMQARIDALAADVRGDQRSTLEELARGIHDLGDRIKRIPRD
jgi:hypothetical protein